jgi:hypothetical protein
MVPKSNFRFPHSNLAEAVFLFAADSSMVPEEEPSVTPQLPTGGDVSL